MLEQFQSLTLLDWATTILALIYVFLAARNNPWCWVFGALACAVWCYVDIVQYDLYSDAALQAFYVVMSGFGIYQWQFGGKESGELSISRMSLTEHVGLITVSIGVGLLLGYFVSQNFAAAATYPDAITTVASVGATFLLLRRKLENWLYWIVIDLAYVGIFWSREAWLFAGIMVIYVLVAVYGYLEWKREVGRY